MKALCVETSQNMGSVAVSENGHILSSCTWSRQKSHSELITVVIEHALLQSGCALKDLDGLIVSAGPGSFTGIRVGVNATKSLAYALKIPVLGVDSLSILAHQVKDFGKVAAVIYGFRDIVYVAQFEKTAENCQQIVSPRALTADSCSSLLIQSDTIVGNAIDFLDWEDHIEQKWQKSPDINQPIASTLARNFWQDLHPGLPDQEWSQLQPIFIRDSEPEEKLRAHQDNQRS